jgi:hypothetical protein
MAALIAPTLRQQTKVAQGRTIADRVVKRRLDVKPARHLANLYPLAGARNISVFQCIGIRHRRSELIAPARAANITGPTEVHVTAHLLPKQSAETKHRIGQGIRGSGDLSQVIIPRHVAFSERVRHQMRCFVRHTPYYGAAKRSFVERRKSGSQTGPG